MPKSCHLLVKLMLIFGIFTLQSCSGGGGNGDNSSDSPAPPVSGTPNTQPTTTTSTIGPTGGSISLAGIVDLVLPSDLVTELANVKVESVTSLELNHEFLNGTAALGVLSAETYHVKIDGLPLTATADKIIQAKFTLSDVLASKVTSTAAPAATIWTLNSSEEEELAHSEVLPSQYDSSTKILTVSIPVSLLTATEPITRQSRSALQAILRVALFEVVPPSSAQRSTRVATSPQQGTRLLAGSVVSPGEGGGDVCGNTDWLSPMSGRYDIVGPFAEYIPPKPGATPHNGNHTGLDIIAPKGTPIRAVDDGYIDKVHSQNCSGSRSQDCDTISKPIYYLSIKLNSGDRVVYMHIDNIGDLPFCTKDARGNSTCLKNEPDIKRLWQETDATNPRYKVKKGDIVAHSSNTGAPAAPTGGYHLHITYKPVAIGTPNNPQNPLCKIVKLKATPETINLPSTVPGDDVVSLSLVDNEGHQYRVRRLKGTEPPDVYLSSAAVPVTPLTTFEESSRAVVLITTDRSLDTAIADYDRSYTDPDITRLSTDNGKIKILPKSQGTTTLFINPQIYKDRAGAAGPLISLGGQAAVTINNATNEDHPSAWQAAFTINQCNAVRGFGSGDPCNGHGGHGFGSWRNGFFWLADSAAKSTNMVYKWQINDGTFSSYEYKSVPFENGVTKNFVIPVRHLLPGFSWTYRATITSPFTTKTWPGYDEINPIQFVITTQTESTVTGTFTGSNSYYQYADEEYASMMGHLNLTRLNFSGTWSAIRTKLPKIVGASSDGCGYVKVLDRWAAYTLTATGFTSGEGPACSVTPGRNPNGLFYPY